MKRKNLILEITFKFALDAITFTEKLERLRKFNLANQLFKSATSIGAHVREAQGSESRSDFVHKMKGGYKEAEESSYWLEICESLDSYPKPGKLLDDIQSILRILGRIISTSKN